MKRYYNQFKRLLLLKSQIPIGLSNKVANLIVKKIIRYQPEKGYELNFFNRYYNNNYALGPLQKDEAILLYGMIRVLRPKVCLEFGFNLGHSAFSILKAIDDNAYLFSFDISDSSEAIAKKFFYKKFKNFKFVKKSQTDFEFSDIQNQKIDFVFFDASHDLNMNIKTFSLIKPFLSDNAYIVIHDTGLWDKKFMEERHHQVLSVITHKELNGLISHQIEEREFSNWILNNVEGISVLHYHSLNTLRHGLSVFSNVNPKLLV